MNMRYLKTNLNNFEMFQPNLKYSCFYFIINFALWNWIRRIKIKYQIDISIIEAFCREISESISNIK